MSTATDPHVGTWVLNPSRSEFDANHRPRAATMVIERDAQGHYQITASGTSEKGQPVAERPQTWVPDGQPRPLPGLPGLTATCERSGARTLQTAVKREDGSLAGQAVFAVSEDGTLLTATNSGFDAQLRPFQQQTVWERR
jgi:hypothetical protein